MDERIESFLKDGLELKGGPRTAIRDGVRSYLAICENLVRDTKPDVRKRERLRANGGAAVVSEWPKRWQKQSAVPRQNTGRVCLAFWTAAMDRRHPAEIENFVR